MIFTILSVVFVIAGIAGLLEYHRRYEEPEWLFYLSVLILGLGIVTTTVCSCIVAGTQFNADIKYQNMVAEKTAIEYRLTQIDTNDKNVLVNGGVYDDILKYNAKLRDIKKWGKNPWTSWFYVSKMTELDYINLPEGVN